MQLATPWGSNMPTLLLRKAALCGLFFCLAPNAIAAWFNDTRAIMGTEVSVSLWSDTEGTGKQAVEGVMAIMEGVNQRLSPYIASSDLAKLNSEAAKAPVLLTDEIDLLYRQSLWMFHQSEGAFDITYASVGRLYDYRQKVAPTQKELEAHLGALSTRHLVYDAKARSLAFSQPDVTIDLGGIAKGYAVDLAINYLKGLGIKHAYVGAGGDSRILGDRRGRPWVIGIKNPRMKEGGVDTVIKLPLSDVAVSTSGDYERFFIDDSGERIHHIINPKTGKSASEVMSVTILGEEGIATDPLSTAVFVLGVQKGINLVDKLSGFDAIIIDSTGQVHYSNGLMPPSP